MTRSTEQWKALLEGTVPGPWRHRGYGYIDTESGEPINGQNDWDGAVHPDCGDLAAAAPEAVAEVIRLRRELESLRDACIEEAESMERNAKNAYSPEACEAVSNSERDTAAIITRILNPKEK